MIVVISLTKTARCWPVALAFHITMAGGVGGGDDCGGWV